jgi:heterotetrameric sarcosine oxidase gamma subunit
VSELEFLSPDLARAGDGFEPFQTSPLRRALREVPGLTFRDLSQTAQIELRGELGGLAEEELAGALVRLAPERALLVCEQDDAARMRAALSQRVATVVDVTGAYARLAVEGERAEALLRRVSDLDMAGLPAAGAVARVPAIVRGGGTAFELIVPQEYGHYVTEVLMDAAEGLGSPRPSSGRQD